MAKRVSVINFKGGVGKTTLAFHVAAGLARYHRSSVLVVDVDHQSSLSIVCLGAEGWQRAVDAGKTVDKVFRTFFGSESALRAADIVIEKPMEKKSGAYGRLDIAPASLDLDDTEIELTASHQGNAIRSEWNKRTLVCKWIEYNDLDKQYDYIIFDCPPATKIVSQNAIAASHGYIIPVVPESVMVRGVPHLHKLIRSGIDRQLKALAAMGDTRTIHVADTALVGLAITRIQSARGGYTRDHSAHLASIKREWGSDLIDPYIPQGTGISQALAASVPVYDRSETRNVGRMRLHNIYRKLTDNIKLRVDRL